MLLRALSVLYHDGTTISTTHQSYIQQLFHESYTIIVLINAKANAHALSSSRSSVLSDRGFKTDFTKTKWCYFITNSRKIEVVLKKQERGYASRRCSYVYGIIYFFNLRWNATMKYFSS